MFRRLKPKNSTFHPKSEKPDYAKSVKRHKTKHQLMTKNQIIDLLTPKCNGVALPLSLDVQFIAELLAIPEPSHCTDVDQRYDAFFTEGAKYGYTEGFKMAIKILDDVLPTVQFTKNTL